MKRIIIIMLCVWLLAVPVSAMDFTAPEAPDAAQKYMTDETESFADGLWYIICTAVADLQPEIAQAASSCLALIAVAVLLSLMQSASSNISAVAELVGTIGIAGVLIKPTNTFIALGVETVNTLSEYGKILIPVMTSAMAAQGATTSATAIYTATALFDMILSTGISKLMIPMLYMYLCLCIVNSAVTHNLVNDLRSFVKWLMTWILKIVLYIFTGYITISGVISGTADASAIKAAKIAISGSVPVVGSILSDASEAILVSAGVMKNAAGVYGILTMIALFISPFLKIGIQHIFLKLTAAICSVFGSKRCISLIQDFSSVMGLLLAMTGTICLLHLISTVCFMKGVA